MGKRFVAIISIIISIVVLMPSGLAVADGEREDILMDARVGFGGHFRLEHWTPIVVEIENKGEDIRGNLEVLAYQDSNSGIIYSRPVVIAGHSKKRFHLYIQVRTIQRQMEIKLLQDGNVIKTKQVQGLTPMTWSKYLMGVVTEDKAALSYWWHNLNNNRIFSNHDTVHLNLEDIPDRKEILDNFAVLVINNADTTKLSEKQREVLATWVEGGGVLIVGTGINGRKTLGGLYSQVVPFEAGDIYSTSGIQALEDISGKALQGEAFRLMELKPKDAEVVLDNEGRGIVWKVRRGAGYIFVSAFDMGTAPIVDWAGNKIFWDNLLSIELDNTTAMKLKNPQMGRELGMKYGMEQYYQIRDALSSIKAMDLPSFTSLLLILLAYLAVVGPINYIVLKRIDKREWAWVTIPMLVLVFSVGIYALGYTKKGNEVIVNTITTVHLKSNSKVAQTNTYAGIFIPRRGDYSVNIDKDALITMAREGYNTVPTQNPDDVKRIIQAKVIQGKPSGLEIYDANVWTMRTFMISDTNGEFGQLKSDLYYNDGKIKGTITNSTPYPLSDLVMYTSYGYKQVGNIAAGETKQVDIRISIGGLKQGGYHQGIYQMLDQLYPHPNRGVAGMTDEDREKWTKRRIVEGLVVRPLEMKLGIIDDSSFVKAFAFTDHKVSEDILIEGEKPGTSYHRGVITADLDISFERDGKVSIPPGFIKGVLNQELSDRAHSEPDGIYLDRGVAVFSFDMKPYFNIELNKVEINTNIFHGSAQFFVYDVEKDDFIDVDDGLEINTVTGTVTFEPATLDRFINSEGILQLKIETGGRDSLRVSVPSLVLEGRKR